LSFIYTEEDVSKEASFRLKLRVSVRRFKLRIFTLKLMDLEMTEQRMEIICKILSFIKRIISSFAREEWEIKC